MYLSKGLHELYSALLSVESDVTSNPAEVEQGICALLKGKLGRDHYTTTGLTKGLASTWPAYSGDPFYPVPSSAHGVNAYSAFWLWPSWLGRYGRNRMSLLHHMIKEVRGLRSFAIMSEIIVEEAEPYVVRRLHAALTELRQSKLVYTSGRIGICNSLGYEPDSWALFRELVSKYAFCFNMEPDFVVAHPSMSASDAYFELNNLWDYKLLNDDGCYARRRMFLLNLLCEVTDNADPNRGTSIFDIYTE